MKPDSPARSTMPPRLATTLLAGVCATLLSGCAASVARNMCAKAGLSEGSQEHSTCTSNLRARWKTEAQSDLANAVALSAVVAGAAAEARYGGQPQLQPQPRLLPMLTSTESLRREWPTPKGRMCSYANGTVLNVGNGSCPASIAAPR